MSYPTKRDLDGVYFRVERDGEWEPICYTDMTEQEREEVVAKPMYAKPLEEQALYWQRMTNIMADTLRQVGDQFGIVGE